MFYFSDLRVNQDPSEITSLTEGFAWAPQKWLTIPWSPGRPGNRILRESSFFTAKISSGLPRSTRNFGNALWNISRN